MGVRRGGAARAPISRAAGSSARRSSEFGVGFAPSAWDRLLVGAQQTASAEASCTPPASPSAAARAASTTASAPASCSPCATPAAGSWASAPAPCARASSRSTSTRPRRSVYRKGRSLFGIDLARAARHAGRAGDRRRGLHGRDRSAPGRASRTSSPPWAPRSPTSRLPSSPGSHARSCSPSTPTARGGRRCCECSAPLRGRGVDLKVIPLPDDKDPCDLLQGEGSEIFATREEQAVSFLRFQVESAMEGANVSSAADKDRLIAELRPVFADAEPSAERDEQIRYVASRLDLSEQPSGAAARPSAHAAPNRPAPPRRGAEREGARPAHLPRDVREQRRARPQVPRAAGRRALLLRCPAPSAPDGRSTTSTLRPPTSRASTHGSRRR